MRLKYEPLAQQFGSGKHESDLLKSCGKNKKSEIPLMYLSLPFSLACERTKDFDEEPCITPCHYIRSSLLFSQLPRRIHDVFYTNACIYHLFKLELKQFL